MIFTDFNPHDEKNVKEYEKKCLGKAEVLLCAFYFIVMQIYILNKNSIIKIPLINYDLYKIVNDSGFIKKKKRFNCLVR